MTAPTTLSELQAWFAEQLVRPRALSKYPDSIASAAQHIVGLPALAPVERLEIYREQFWLRHTASLLEDFPGVSGILGQAEWERLSESYLTRYPCRSFNLRDLGVHFAQHIAEQDALPERRLCLDMARLEWCYVEIFDAAEVPPLDGDKLAALSEHAWQQAQIVINPAVRLLRVKYPVVMLRQQLRQTHDQDDDNESSDEPVPIPDPEAHNLLLYRDSDQALRHESLPLLAWQLLERSQRGDTLVAACEAVATGNPKQASVIETEVGAWFAQWARLNVVVDVRT
jgi:hypothetical protein